MIELTNTDLTRLDELRAGAPANIERDKVIARYFLAAGIERCAALGEPLTANHPDDPLANSHDGGIRRYIKAIRALLKE